MEQLLVAFIRLRVIGRDNVDLGELFDAAERYLNRKVEPREFFCSFEQALRQRRIRRKNRFMTGT